MTCLSGLPKLSYMVKCKNMLEIVFVWASFTARRIKNQNITLFNLLKSATFFHLHASCNFFWRHVL